MFQPMTDRSGTRNQIYVFWSRFLLLEDLWGGITMSWLIIRTPKVNKMTLIKLSFFYMKVDNLPLPSFPTEGCISIYKDKSSNSFCLNFVDLCIQWACYMSFAEPVSFTIHRTTKLLTFAYAPILQNNIIHTLSLSLVIYWIYKISSKKFISVSITDHMMSY